MVLIPMTAHPVLHLLLVQSLQLVLVQFLLFVPLTLPPIPFFVPVHVPILFPVPVPIPVLVPVHDHAALPSLFYTTLILP